MSQFLLLSPPMGDNEKSVKGAVKIKQKKIDGGKCVRCNKINVLLMPAIVPILIPKNRSSRNEIIMT
jgi:hypothetical protein